MTLSINGTARPAVNVSEEGSSKPLMASESHIAAYDNLESYASENPFLALCAENDEECGLDNGQEGQLPSQPEAERAAKVNNPALSKATTEMATLHSFPWPAISFPWLAIGLILVTVVLALGGWAGTATFSRSTMALAPLNESGDWPAAHKPLPQCPVWTGFDETFSQPFEE